MTSAYPNSVRSDLPTFSLEHVPLDPTPLCRLSFIKSEMTSPEEVLVNKEGCTASGYCIDLWKKCMR